MLYAKEVFFTSGKPLLSSRNWNTGIPPDTRGFRAENKSLLTQQKNSGLYGQRGSLQ